MKVISEQRERDDLLENWNDEDEHKNNQCFDWLNENMRMEELKSIQKSYQTVKQKLWDLLYKEK